MASKSSNITTRKGTGAFQSIRADNKSASAKEKVPITLSEKFSCFEKKFGAAMAEVAQLKTELNLTKDELADARMEIENSKKENTALHTLLVRCDQEIKMIGDELAELRNLQKNILAKNVNAGGNIAGVAGATLHRAVLAKLPCQGVAELKQLIEDIRDLDTLIYIEKRLGRIGGSDLKSCLTGILDRLMSKELQREMCLTGKRTTKDGLMQYHQIMDLINNAVRYSFPNYKDKDGESTIGKILQK